MGNAGSRAATRHAAVALLSLAWVMAGGNASHDTVWAQGQTVEQLQAAVMVTLARFVEWPPKEFASPTAPVVIGVVADEQVAAALETSSRGKNVAGRPLEVTRLQWDSDPAGVHMLFVGAAEKRHLSTVLDRVRSRPVVTVSGLPDFGRAGGMITLTLTERRITFAVNSRATTVAAVTLSSFMLSHATKVSDQSSGGSR
jgi:hypothetical protein